MNTPIRYGPHDKYIDVWGVQSDSRPDKIYTIARTALDVWSCSCPHWTRNFPRPVCKHIKHVKFYKDMLAGFAPVVMPESVKKSLGLFSAIEL